MRNITFRGRRIDNGKWVKGFYGWSMGRHYITEIINESPTLSDPGGTYIENSYEVNEDTIGQFADILDSKYKMVFEHDIVQYEHETGKVIAKVVFKESEDESMLVSGFFFDLIRIEDFENDETVPFEVIGNIFDNTPHFLTGEHSKGKLYNGKTFDEIHDYFMNPKLKRNEDQGN